jgi:hypothetical protein
MCNQVEMYKAARERLRSASLRGEDTDAHESVAEAIWSMMSDADRRIVLGVGEPSMQRRAA